MTIYLALLRGINVGGNKKIKMAELKQMLEEMGLSQVKTYIQSGNVLFVSDEEADSLQKRIEERIELTFGFSAAVLLRTAAELNNVLEHCPFSFESLAEGESIHVSFLSAALSQEEIDTLSAISFAPDEFQIIGKEAYMLLRQSILDSKLPIQLQKIVGTMTARNWKTVLKLGALAETISHSNK